MWPPRPHALPGCICASQRCAESLALDKVKGTLVDFDMLEHLLDDQEGIAAWQIELRKHNDDPLEVDELHLHVAPESGVTTSEIERMISSRFHQVTEPRPTA